MAMTTDNIRDAFLDFFKTKNHTICASDLLVPKDDPTVLFTSAGMNQFKEQFMGKTKGFTRAATAQKCLRTGDLENVGRTPSHHTFFEMLGNFSFGDYFKIEAISLAWEFLTVVLKLPPEKLWVSVHNSDKEAYDIWRDVVRIPEQRIVRLGDKENFWPSNAPKLGPNGPCGPCSEIFYDRGENSGCGKADCSPACTCSRFVEIWNLVFTQYSREDNGKLTPLPAKNIDTGMGLERIASVMQGVNTNFEIDIFKPIINEIIKNSALKITDKEMPSVYTIADHIRAVTFAICDGVMPSNEERGYVIRKLIRKAVWHGKNIGINKPFLYKIVPIVSRVMLKTYPGLEQRRENISQIVQMEEKRFSLTLQEGEVILENMLQDLREKNKQLLSGENVFKLYDTYGFPPELTAIAAARKGIEIDMAGFKQELEKQVARSKITSKIDGGIFVEGAPKELAKFFDKVAFIGYEKLTQEAKILFLMKGNDKAASLNTGETGSVVLSVTPFYAEAGGQVGDTGIIENKNFKADVINTKKIDDVIVHIIKVASGKITLGDKVHAEVNTERRKHIARNHTATHILHNVLRKVLGPHVEQAGSLVSDDRLRFDFTHFQGLSLETLNRIEELVNTNILNNTKVDFEVMDIEAAKKTGAMALFGEKYGQIVRVVSIGDYSKEFCAGTHLSSTGEIGLFKIISEGSISSGIRRIEAVTGALAYAKVKQDEAALLQIMQMLNAPKERLLETIEKNISRVKLLEKELVQFKMRTLAESLDKTTNEIKVIEGVPLLIKKIPSCDMDGLRKTYDLLKNKINSAIIVLASDYNGMAQFICGISPDIIAKGYHAGAIARHLAQMTGGNGGGRPNMAQAGGRSPEKLDDALNSLPGMITTLKGKS